MRAPFHLRVALVFLLLQWPVRAAAQNENAIEWLLHYQAGSLPGEPWKPSGAPVAALENGALRLKDESQREAGCFEAEWTGDLTGKEIVVEACVRLVSMVGHRDSPVATWPQRDGAPVCIEVCDGARVEGILFTPPAYRHPGAAAGYVRTLTDRFAQTDTREFHTYRLIIRGQNLCVEQDGRQIIEGCDAFWRPAKGARKYVRFGSTSQLFTGEAEWQFVRLGLREGTAVAEAGLPVRVVVGEPWPLNTGKRNDESRPYLYDMGRGLLLMSNPQGSDALREPYGVRRSLDSGKTWTLIEGLDHNVDAPQEMLRLSDGRILGVSRWTQQGGAGALRGVITMLDPTAETFATYESEIQMPEKFRPNQRGEVLIFERHIWQEPDESLTAVAWTRLDRIPLTNGRFFPERRTHLMRSTDLGRTWTHYAEVGVGGEPAVVRLSKTEWLCVARPDAHMSNLVQHRSLDGGVTWAPDRMLEEGSVMPDLVLMSHGVLACSYGRPVSGIMFSADGGRSWRKHTVIADRVGFNYTTIREIAPGRLLFMDDARLPGALSRIYGCYVDVLK